MMGQGYGHRDWHRGRAMVGPMMMRMIFSLMDDADGDGKLTLQEFQAAHEFPTTIEQVRAGKLRALAVTSGTRSQALPDVPTIGEFVPGYEASVWNGVVAPKNTPAEIIGKLYKEIDAVLADPKIMARFAEVGSVPKSMTPADFGKFIAEDTERWGKVIQAANIKPE